MIVSIPHTGTGFLKRFFKLLGEDVHNAHIRETVAVKDYMGEYRTGRPVVIPLRDPAENMLSHWHRRRFHAQHHTRGSATDAGLRPVQGEGHLQFGRTTG